MANYWITTNAKFRPFSYDEMIRPVEKMYTEHKGVEEGLAELQTKAGIWEGLANEQTDPVTYAQYKRYADELRMAADDLAMNGLNARSRQNLYNMKARYASEITPIEQAYQSRREQRKAQEVLLAQNPDIVLSREAGTTSLDKYLENPELSYKGINGEAVRTRVLQEAALLGKSENRAYLRNILDNNDDFLEYVKENGYSGEAILAAISKSENADAKLSELLNRTVKATGVYDWRNADGSVNTQAIERVWDYAASGLWGAGKSVDSNIMVNQPKMQREGWAHESAEAQKQRDFQAEQNRLSRESSQKIAEMQSGIYTTPDGFKININNGAIIDPNDKLTHIYGQPVGDLGLGSTSTSGGSSQTGNTSGIFANALAALNKAKKNFGNLKDPDKEVMYPNLDLTRGDLNKIAGKVSTVGGLKKDHRLVPVVGISRHSDAWDRPGPAFAYAATAGKDTPRTWTTDTPLRASGKWTDNRAFPDGLELVTVKDTELEKLPPDDLMMILTAAKQAGFIDNQNIGQLPFTVAKVHNTEYPSRGAEYVILTDDQSVYSTKDIAMEFPVDKSGSLARDPEDKSGTKLYFKNH